MSETLRRTVVAHAQPHLFASGALTILAKLGYSILPADTLEASGGGDGARPDLRIVDERCLGEIPDEDGPPVPVVVISGRQGVTGADPRIVGAVPRPAGLHDLYRLFQQILEERPRSTPRVATHLPATCRRGSEEWAVAVLSLSENGCLVRSPAPVLLGSRLELAFALPGAERIHTQAEAAYQLLPDLGLVFHRTQPAFRQAILRYVTDALVAL